MSTQSPAPASPPAGQEHLLRLLFEQAPGFIAVLQGPRHVFTLANPAYYRLVGRRDLIGRSAAEAVPEAVDAGFIALLDEVYRTGKPFTGRRLSLQLQRSEGLEPELRFFNLVYQPLVDANGSVAGIFCEGHDVTEEVRAEESLRLEAEQRSAQARLFDSALSAIDDFAYTFDRAGRFTYANKPLTDLLGLRPEEIVGKRFPELPYPPELGARLQSELDEVVATRRQVKGETYYKSPTGKDGWYEYIFNPILAVDGSVASIAGSTRDVTIRQEQERRLKSLHESERLARQDAERAGRLKDEFLATLSHELRTPLQAIQGWADLLRSGRLPADQTQKVGERIARNARTQGQLIADLLDMNRIVSGKARLAIERVPIARPIAAAVEAVRIDAARKGVAIDVPASTSSLMLDCDPDRVQQIVWNLLANAIKFTPAGGSISVGVEHGKSDVTVRVADSGAGIAPEFVPRLFERFSQADSSSTRKFGGLGLGLSICKSLVEMHGGEISAESAGEGKGATFSVTLPLAQAGSNEQRVSTWGELEDGDLPAQDTVPSLSGSRILVVDDDDEGRQMLVAALQQYGALVLSASNADDAFDQAQACWPDLLICDIGMPVVDGYQLLWRVRKHSDVPAIALTALAQPSDRQRALESGFAAHVAKPAPPALVIRTCAQVLSARGRAIDAVAGSGAAINPGTAS
jgi:PAS domain S-box-containing protein